MAYLSAITTLCCLSRSVTLRMNTGAAFFALTSSLCVCPNPKRCFKATAMEVLPTVHVSAWIKLNGSGMYTPHPGIATGRMMVFLKSVVRFTMSRFDCNSFAKFPFPSSSHHFKNRSRVAIMPWLLVYPSNAFRFRLISASTQFLYNRVSGLLSFALEMRGSVPGFAVNKLFVSSRQSRYIIYGSSNLTLKKKDEPGGYGGASRSLRTRGSSLVPFSSVTSRPAGAVARDEEVSAMCVRTTKPSIGCPFHFPVLPTLSVNSRTSATVPRVIYAVGIKPQDWANILTSSDSRV